MRRRDFFRAAGAGSILAGWSAACKSESSPSDPTSKTFTSSSDQGHTHTVSIQKTEVQSPPSGGISRQTSSNGHTHTFTMSAGELTSVMNGSSITVRTSDTNGHTHTFTIQKWF